MYCWLDKVMILTTQLQPTPTYVTNVCGVTSAHKYFVYVVPTSPPSTISTQGFSGFYKLLLWSLSVTYLVQWIYAL